MVRKSHDLLPSRSFNGIERSLFGSDHCKVHGIDPQIVVRTPGDAGAVVGNASAIEQVGITQRSQDIASGRDPTGQIDPIGRAISRLCATCPVHLE